MTRRHFSDHHDPDVTLEDMGRPTRGEVARDEPLTVDTTGPLTDAVTVARWYGRRS